MGSLPVIGIAGAARTGKDTAANLLVAALGLKKVAFADPLKRAARDIYDFSDEQLWGPSEHRDKPDRRYIRLDARACERFEPLIERWHEGVKGNPTLHAFLGLTWPEYADWLETGAVHLTPRHALQQLGIEWAARCCPYTLLTAMSRELAWLPDGRWGRVISDVRRREEALYLRGLGIPVIGIRRPDAGDHGAHETEQGLDGFADLLFSVVLNDSSLSVLESRVLRVARKAFHT